MGVIMVPPMDAEPWPTLGPWVVRFIEDNLVHGPGDLLGQPVRLSDEEKGWIYRMYEVEPEFWVTMKGRVRVKTANPRAGRRRFQRCALSLRKGSAKTEKAAWITAAELHEDGPVRCVGFQGGEPIPGPVTDPYIPMISYTEEQTEELAYGALRRILDLSSIASDFDIGLERIMRRGGDGKAEAVSVSPNARDGARTTFEHCDESHRLVLNKQKRAWAVMLANLAKRPLADPWALETTTAPEPGAGSVAESTMDYAAQIAQQEEPATSRLFFYHREAAASHDLTTDAGLRAAIIEASGPFIAAWSDVDRIAAQFRQPDADLAYLERVWLNRCVQASERAFDVALWDGLADPTHMVPAGAEIVLGFDGGRFDDATALVGQHLPSRHLFRLGVWEKPANARDDWQVPEVDVDAAVAGAFSRYTVLRMYCDPPKWEGWIAAWAARYGDEVVVEWWTNRRKPMAYAIRAFRAGMQAHELSHDGDKRLRAHLGNACRHYTNLVDEDDAERRPLWILRKERPDSPHKIDLAMAAMLADEAGRDATTAGLVQGDVYVGVSQL